MCSHASVELHAVMASAISMCRLRLFRLLPLLWTALAPGQEPVPPGQLIDLGGRRLHLNCAGAGSPTVIVENGGGSFSVEWALVQTAVATFARICAYDRAGYAWSDRGPVDDGIEQIIDDLNLLLRRPALLRHTFGLAIRWDRSTLGRTRGASRSRWPEWFSSTAHTTRMSAW